MTLGMDFIYLLVAAWMCMVAWFSKADYPVTTMVMTGKKMTGMCDGDRMNRHVIGACLVYVKGDETVTCDSRRVIKVAAAGRRESEHFVRYIAIYII